MGLTWLVKNKKKTEHDAIKKHLEEKVSPEVRYLFSKSAEPSFDIFRSMFLMMALAGVMILLMAFILLNATFESHYGENEWDNMQASISEENKEDIVSIGGLIWIFPAFIIIDFGLYFIAVFMHSRKHKKIKTELLELMKYDEETEV